MDRFWLNLNYNKIKFSFELSAEFVCCEVLDSNSCLFFLRCILVCRSYLYSCLTYWVLLCLSYQGQICKKADLCLNLYPCVIKYDLIYLSLSVKDLFGIVWYGGTLAKNGDNPALWINRLNLVLTIKFIIPTRRMPLAQQLLTIVLPVWQGVWSSQTGQRWRLHQQLPPGLQHCARGARGDRFRRAETAHRHRPGPHQKPLHPHLGWSHQVGLLAPWVFCFIGQGTGFTSWAGCAPQAANSLVRFLDKAEGDATASNI